MPSHRLLPLVLGLLLVTCPAASAADPSGAAEAVRVLTDFTGETPDLGWFVVNDNVMGGRSQGAFVPEGAQLRFRGRTNTNGGGFSSIRTQPLQLDLSAYDGIRVRVRADGRRYTWRLTTDARWRGRQVSYWADFETQRGEWVEADIPFASFKPQFRGMQLSGPQLDPRRVRGMGLMIYDKQDGPFELRLDRVAAFTASRPFALADLRGSHRVLVLSAPSAFDASLQDQLRDVAGSAEAFADRDLVLVLAVDGAGSRVQERALTSAESVAVRRALSLEGGAFALRLVGLDGGVKRAASEPIAMEELYDLIDAMPMRKAELRERAER